MSKPTKSAIQIASLVPADLMTEGTQVDLYRTWFRPPPGEGFPHVGMVPLKRSDDVRTLFAGLNDKEDQPKYIWAMAAMHDVGEETGLFVRQQKAVGIKKGDLFFMFEPRILRDHLASAMKNKRGLFIGCLGLAMTKVRSGKMHNIRQYDVKQYPKAWEVPQDSNLLAMPQADDMALNETDD